MAEIEKPDGLVSNFIRQIIEKDLAEAKNDGQVVTRFPPEPNGFLHIGHAKAICVNFGMAKDYKGKCHLRFDDTNPVAEDPIYMDAIQEDIRWLGFDWGENLFYASDYFQKLYDYAVQLIKQGQAYVDRSSVEELRKLRGSLTEPGKGSSYRNTSVDENLKLFESMKNGEFEDGACVLRAKIHMASPNMNLRDPILYRIRKHPHPRTGDKWNIYPMYDYTHPLSDMFEGITHSLCSLEFQDHRPLYDWVLDELKTPCHPRQYEFARLNLDYTVMSKRKLLQMVEEGQVTGWDDPRMPTLRGLRRRGYRSSAIRNFADRIGVAKKNSIIDVGMLEQTVREDLDADVPRAMGVLYPIKVVITNYPEGQTEMFEAPVHPKDETRGQRQIPFSKTVYIDSEDFMEVPPNNKYRRLKPGGEVRLRYAYVITCDEVIKNAAGEIVELRCTYDPESKGGVTPEGKKKVKGIIHWVSAEHAIPCEVRLYDRLFTEPNPDGNKEKDFKEFLNPNSLEILSNAFVEPSLEGSENETHVQFERLGFFVTDRVDSKKDNLVFNRTVTLKDTWAK